MKKEIRFKVVAFWSAIIIVTMVFLVLFGIKIFTVTEFKSTEDIDRAKLSVTEVTTKNDGTYYVYIYSSKSTSNLEKKVEVEASVFNYFSYTQNNKNDSSVIKIYGFDTEDYVKLEYNTTVFNYLTSLDPDLTSNNLPALVKVTAGSISESYITINTIQKELQSAMQ